MWCAEAINKLQVLFFGYCPTAHLFFFLCKSLSAQSWLGKLTIKCQEPSCLTSPELESQVSKPRPLHLKYCPPNPDIFLKGCMFIT